MTVEDSTASAGNNLNPREVPVDYGAFGVDLAPGIVTPEEAEEQIGVYARYFAPDSDYETVLQREQGFYAKVYNSALEMAVNNSDPIVLLFDVDQTIADSIYIPPSGQATAEGVTPQPSEQTASKNESGDSSGGESENAPAQPSEAEPDDKTEDKPAQQARHVHIVRPAFAWAIAALREQLGDRLRVGLLTTLRDSSGKLQEELFADMQPDWLASEYIINTRDYADQYPEESAALQAAYDTNSTIGVESIVRSDVLQATTKGTLRMSQWRDSDAKLDILQRLLQATAAAGDTTRFIYFDNLIGAGVIRTDLDRLRGICVDSEIQDPTWHYYAELNARKLEAGLTEAQAIPDQTQLG